ncbi:MAG TPA: lytic murein transglycosylase [Solirubrobacteraceae bacterium]|nr:lytic murein transglycosylase [Solirubrobacteraceae bacterium]
MSAARRWARRAALSIVAGGASIAGPFSHGALGAEAPTSTTAAGEGSGASVTETAPQAPAPETGATGQQGATSTQPTTTTTTSTTTTPASTTTPAPASPPPSSAPAPAAAPATQPGETQAPTVVVQRSQKTTGAPRRSGKSESSTESQGTAGGETGEGAAAKQPGEPATTAPGTPNGVAPAPQTVGGEVGSLASLLAESAVSKQALAFYRIPIFLLPIYQAAAIQYDVPWQILAAINEVETDYGSDQSVSSAGAVGWMQFMPQTWLLYGVDATDAGYADPYNPVDAIFAAARYLHAAGAAKHPREAIFAYNHSQAYVESVMLRARLIAAYPSSAIDALTGLVDGRLPTFAAKVAPGAVYQAGRAGSEASQAGAGAAGSSSATAGALPVSPLAAGAAATQANASARNAPTTDAPTTDAKAADATSGHSGSALPGSTPPPPPEVLAARAAARARAAANAPAKPAQLLELAGRPGAPVLAVQGGRVMHVGDDAALGRYIVLRDIYGDVFTYAGLGSVEPRYPRPKPPARPLDVAQPAPTPTQAASAGHQAPQTLRVKAHASHGHGAAGATPEAPEESETAPAGLGKVRLYAHPGNPLARSAEAHAARGHLTGRWLPLRRGAVVAEGTVLGHLAGAPGPDAGLLRFAVRPAGDSDTIDPAPLLESWRELSAALHPAGSRATDALLGATADAVFAMSKSELQSSVLSDPAVRLDVCARRDIAAGAVDRRVLAVLEFLSRNELAPTVGALRCAPERRTAAGAVFEHFSGDAVEITAINGTPVAGHQGPRTLTDATIRTLLKLPRTLAPRQIVSLMHYPQAPSTMARSSAWDHIRIDFAPLAGRGRAARASRAHSHRPPAAAGDGGSLSASEWNQLIGRIAALPQPKVAVKPSGAAVRDPRSGAAGGGLDAQP